MFNNINDSTQSYLYNTQLDGQSNVIRIASIRANAYKTSQTSSKNPYVDTSEISANAIALFEKDSDIEKFNKIAMSDPEDLSHLDRMQELFAEGVVDIFEDDVLEELVTNSKLWDDLES